MAELFKHSIPSPSTGEGEGGGDDARRREVTIENQLKAGEREPYATRRTFRGAASQMAAQARAKRAMATEKAPM